MSFLAPWFLLGTLFVAAPLVFHLVRRTPRGRQVFSSLMFLRASPPRIRRRSRLEEPLLLALRCAVIGLLALAFARPHLSPGGATPTATTGRQVAVLVDTSASMRREGVWAEALSRVRDTLGRAGSGDQVALYTFDDHVREVVGFGPDGMAALGRAAILDTLAAGHPPTWGGTDLGGALVSVADRLDAAAEEPGAAGGPAELVLVSDLQRGSRLAALDGYTWPRRVRLVPEMVGTAARDNAGLVAASAGRTGIHEAYRVQVLREGTDSTAALRIRWLDEAGDPLPDRAVEIEVPAGEARVLSLPRPEAVGGALVLELTGDAHPFDNLFHVAPTLERPTTVLYLGSESADDPEGARFYLERALVGTSRRDLRVATRPPGRPLFREGEAMPHLVVGTAGAACVRAREIRPYVEAGGTMVCIVAPEDRAEDLQTLLELEHLSVEAVTPPDFALLGQIDFAHPLFARFARPRFNDFTAIRFWRLTRIEGLPGDDPDVRVAARFDHGAPYLVDRRIGKGRVLLLTSGWHPEDSRLALSTKFVPLLEGMVEGAEGGDAVRTDYAVNETIPVPDGTDRVRMPDGRTVDVRAGREGFAEARVPGIYAFEGEEGRRLFAVHLDSAESRTSPMSLDDLEQRGVLLQGQAVVLPPRTVRVRGEGEASQQLWKWLLRCALGVILIETWFAGRRAAAPPGVPGEEAALS